MDFLSTTDMAGDHNSIFFDCNTILFGHDTTNTSNNNNNNNNNNNSRVIGLQSNATLVSNASNNTSRGCLGGTIAAVSDAVGDAVGPRTVMSDDAEERGVGCGALTALETESGASVSLQGGLSEGKTLADSSNSKNSKSTTMVLGSTTTTATAAERPMHTRNVYVSGLPPHFRSNDFRSLCQQFGRVEASKLCIDGSTRPTKGYGFALFYSSESASACIAGLNGTLLSGRCLQARLADTDATPQPMSAPHSATPQTSAHGKRRGRKHNSNNTNTNNHNSNSNSTSIISHSSIPALSVSGGISMKDVGSSVVYIQQPQGMPVMYTTQPPPPPQPQPMTAYVADGRCVYAMPYPQQPQPQPQPTAAVYLTSWPTMPPTAAAPPPTAAGMYITAHHQLM